LRLNTGERQALVERRKHEDIERWQQPRHIVSDAEEVHPSLKRHGLYVTLQGAFRVAIANQKESRVLACGDQFSDNVNGEPLVLGRSEVADVNEGDLTTRDPQ
jgi:hypothetical protein